MPISKLDDILQTTQIKFNGRIHGGEGEALFGLHEAGYAFLVHREKGELRQWLRDNHASLGKVVKGPNTQDVTLPRGVSLDEFLMLIKLRFG